MGILDNMSVMLGNMVPSAVFNWIRAVSLFVDGESGGLSQANWFIDPVNGNDNSDGATLATALKTDAERQRRWGNIAYLTVPTTVTYTSSPPVTDIVNYYVSYGNGASLRVVGTPTVTNPAVTLTAVTTLNRATQTPWDITGATLGAADVGRIVRITSAARVNNYAVVEKDLTGGKVRVSPFGNLDIASSASVSFCFVGVTPIAGDIVETIVPPTLTIGSIIVYSKTNQQVTSAPLNCVVFDTVQLDGTAAGSGPINGTIYSLGANIYHRSGIMKNVRLTGNGGHWMAGGMVSTNVQVQGIFSLNGGPFCQFWGTGTLNASVLTVQAGASCIIGGDFLLQNASLLVQGQVNGEFISAFDRSVANFAVQIFPGGVYRSRPVVTTDLLWGDANTGVGVKVFSGGMLTYVVKPTINTALGAGRMSLIGGTNKDWAAVPFVEPANNAMIVVDQ